MRAVWVMIGLVLLSGAVAADFTATDPVTEVTPGEFDVRVEDPYDQEASAIRQTDSLTKWEMSLETSTNETILVYVATEDIALIGEETNVTAEEVTVRVNGERVNSSVENHLDKQWVVFNASGQSTVTISSGAGGQLGLLEVIRRTFLQSPFAVSIVLTVLFVGVVGGYQIYSASTKVDWLG